MHRAPTRNTSLTRYSTRVKHLKMLHLFGEIEQKTLIFGIVFGFGLIFACKLLDRFQRVPVRNQQKFGVIRMIAAREIERLESRNRAVIGASRF